MIEKGLDILRTSFPVQQSATLSFKPCGLTIPQLREASEIGKAVCRKAIESKRMAASGEPEEDGFAIVI